MPDTTPIHSSSARAHAARSCKRVELLLALLFACGCAAPGLPKAPHTTPRAPSAETTRQQLELLNARQPLPGVTTGGTPTLQQLEQARRLGYQSVISLLPESEMAGEPEQVRALGLRFVSIPVPNAAALTEANARLLASAMDAPGAKPLILHCGIGNRAGALLALRAFYVDRASPEDALALGVQAGLTSLRPQVEAQMRSSR